MNRWVWTAVALSAMALAPRASLASSRHKQPDVQIWPPPAAGTDQAGQAVEKPKPKPPPPDAGDPLALDPSLTGEDPDAIPNGPPPAPTPKKGPPDDPCNDVVASCREDCAISHSNDDTLHVKPGQPLPVTVCLRRCAHRYDTCEEQRDMGLRR